jgi:hypothetical protein
MPEKYVSDWRIIKMTVCTRGAAFGLEVRGSALRALRLTIDFPSSVAVLK